LHTAYIFFVNSKVIIHVTAYVSEKSGRHLSDQF